MKVPSEIDWIAPEFEYEEKDVLWFWGSIIAAVLIFAIAVWQKNFLFGLFTILAEILILVWGAHEPRQINFKLGENGLEIGKERKYSFQELESFSIDKDWVDNGAELQLKIRGRLKSALKIIVPSEKISEVRSMLENRLSEKDPEHSISEILERFLRF